MVTVQGCVAGFGSSGWLIDRFDYQALPSRESDPALWSFPHARQGRPNRLRSLTFGLTFFKVQQRPLTR